LWRVSCPAGPRSPHCFLPFSKHRKAVFGDHHSRFNDHHNHSRFKTGMARQCLRASLCSAGASLMRRVAGVPPPLRSRRAGALAPHLPAACLEELLGGRICMGGPALKDAAAADGDGLGGAVDTATLVPPPRWPIAAGGRPPACRRTFVPTQYTSGLMLKMRSSTHCAAPGAGARAPPPGPPPRRPPQAPLTRRWAPWAARARPPPPPPRSPRAPRR
jgi:hypothetical protein